MRIQLQLIITFLLYSIMMIGQTNDTIKQLDIVDWTTLKNEAFEISHPNEWEVNETGLAGTTFILFSPVENQSDLFRDNVNLIIQDLSGYNLTLEKYIEFSLKQLPSMVEDSKVLFSETVEEKGKVFQKLIYTGKQGIYDLRFEQYILIIEEVVYILTLTCEINTFDYYQSTGGKIMDSFAIIK